jgi:predicted RNase H-like nuclease
MSVYLGVARAGDRWLAVAFDQSEFDHVAMFSEVGDLWYRYEERAEHLLVGVPVGLNEGGGDRECDLAARQVLGPRRETVFSPPVREATRKRRYAAAKRVHERTAGRNLSERAFASSDAIAAVDELVRNVPEARAAVAGSHPEVCFRAFAGTPLQHPAETAGGYAERMRALATFDTDAPPVVQRAAGALGGSDLTVHDLLDAVALAYTARPGPGALRPLPPDPPRDPQGLPMAIHYRASDPLGADR